MGIAEPDQANLLIDTGLLLDSELHDCELFDGSCYITQCFKCYQYNHTAKHCRSVARCGFCDAAGHSSQDCNKKEDRTAFYCIPCRKQGHISWARECLIRKRQIEKAQQAYTCRPSKFQVRATSSKPINTATSILTNNILRQASPITASPRDPFSDSIIEVEMPDQESESETELEPLASRAPALSQIQTLGPAADHWIPLLWNWEDTLVRINAGAGQMTGPVTREICGLRQ